jgi:hypothetical protein
MHLRIAVGSEVIPEERYGGSMKYTPIRRIRKSEGAVMRVF